MKTNIKKNYFTKSFLIASFISILIFLNITSFYDEKLILIVCCSLVLVIANFLLYYYSREVYHLLFFPTILLTWIYFQRPFISDTEIWYNSRVIPSKFLLEIVLFPALGILALFLGYYTSFRKNYIFPISNPELKISNTLLSTLIYVFIFLGALNRFIEFSFPEIYENSGQLLFILKQSGTTVVALSTIYYLRKGRNFLLIVLVIMFSVVEYLFCIMSTLFAEIIVLFGGGFLMYIMETKKIPFKLIFLFFLINIPVYANRFTYRLDENVEKQSQSFLSSLTKGQEIFIDNIVDFEYENLFKEDDNNEKDQELDRMEQVSYLGQTVYHHEIRGKPFQDGATFWWLPLVPIPRIIFPEKPENLMGTKVAENYGLRNPDANGVMNFPMLVEYYINFGFWAIIIFSFLQGVTYKWIFKKVNYGGGDLNLLILMSIMLQVMKIEANITLVYGQILQILIFWWLIIYIFNLNQKQPLQKIHIKKNEF